MIKHSKLETLNSSSPMKFTSYKWWVLTPKSKLSTFLLFILCCSMLVIATCNIQDSSFKDEHLGHLKYNGYEGHWWMPNKDPKDLHLDYRISTLQVCNSLKFICCIESTIYAVWNGKWWNCTMQISWTGYHWHE
jgi:hypothetical protein